MGKTVKKEHFENVKSAETEEPSDLFNQRLLLSFTEFIPKDANAPSVQCQFCGVSCNAGVRAEVSVLQATDENGKPLKEPIDNRESVIMCLKCYCNPANNFSDAVMYLANSVLDSTYFEGNL